MNKSLKLILLSASASLLLAACGDETEAPTTETEPAQEEQTAPEEESTDQTEGDGQTEEQPAEETDQTEQTEDTTESDDQEQTDSSTESDSPGIENMEFEVSLDDAIQTFRDETGDDEVNFEEIYFEEEDGRYLYEIEGYSGNIGYEMDLDAETGDVLDFEQDDEDDNDEPLDLDGIVTPQEAMEAALEDAGSGYVQEWDLDVEDGTTYYDIDIEEGEDRDVDAHSGNIL